MKCRNCNAKLEKKWNFCPECGFQIVRMTLMDKLLSKAVSQIGPFKEMNKVMEEMQKKKISPQKNAFSISIKFGGNNNEPQVRIQPLGSMQNAPIAVPNYNREEKVKKEFSRKASGEITEPKAEVKRIGNKMTANILLPDIDSENDIEIRKMGESIEVRAYTKDKTYFKILKCPPTSEIVNQNFQDGKLLLEIA